MKAITLWQPWATMIALGHKTIETRSHDKFAGLVGQQLAIHAGKSYDDMALEYLLDEGYAPIQSLLIEPQCPRGAVVAVCKVEAFRKLSRHDARAACCQCGDWLFGLILTDVRMLGFPVPARGKQGVWEWTPPEDWTVEKDTVPVEMKEAREK